MGGGEQGDYLKNKLCKNLTKIVWNCSQAEPPQVALPSNASIFIPSRYSK